MPNIEKDLFPEHSVSKRSVASKPRIYTRKGKMNVRDLVVIAGGIE